MACPMGIRRKLREVSINILQGYRSQPMLLIGGGPGLCVLLRISLLGSSVNTVRPGLGGPCFLRRFDPHYSAYLFKQSKFVPRVPRFYNLAIFDSEDVDADRRCGLARRCYIEPALMDTLP